MSNLPTYKQAGWGSTLNNYLADLNSRVTALQSQLNEESDVTLPTRYAGSGLCNTNGTLQYGTTTLSSGSAWLTADQLQTLMFTGTVYFASTLKSTASVKTQCNKLKLQDMPDKHGVYVLYLLYTSSQTVELHLSETSITSFAGNSITVVLGYVTQTREGFYVTFAPFISTETGAEKALYTLDPRYQITGGIDNGNGDIKYSATASGLNYSGSVESTILINSGNYNIRSYEDYSIDDKRIVEVILGEANTITLNSLGSQINEYINNNKSNNVIFVLLSITGMIFVYKDNNSSEINDSTRLQLYHINDLVLQQLSNIGAIVVGKYTYSGTGTNTNPWSLVAVIGDNNGIPVGMINTLPLNDTNNYAWDKFSISPNQIDTTTQLINGYAYIQPIIANDTPSIVQLNLTAEKQNNTPLKFVVSNNIDGNDICIRSNELISLNSKRLDIKNTEDTIVWRTGTDDNKYMLCENNGYMLKLTNSDRDDSTIILNTDACAVAVANNTNDATLEVNALTFSNIDYSSAFVLDGDGNTALTIRASSGDLSDTHFSINNTLFANEAIFAGKNIYVSGTVSVTSDKRYKHNIQPIATNALAAINSLPIVSFDFINDANHKTYVGTIAQDVQKVLPLLVDETDDSANDGYSDKLTLQETKLVYVCMKAIQELSAELDRLKHKLGE